MLSECRNHFTVLRSKRMQRNLFRPLILTLYWKFIFCTFDDTPQQIRLAIAGMQSENIVVSWVTETKPVGTSIVQYGVSKQNLDQTVSANRQNYKFGNYTSGYIAHAILHSLKSKTKYYYKCGIKGGTMSDLNFFISAPDQEDADRRVTVGIIGDLGNTANSRETVRLLNKHQLQAIINAGDLSYADGKQTLWDQWGRLIEPSTSHVPWMVTVGNHDLENPALFKDKSTDQYIAYQARFRMPYHESQAFDGNLYYSFVIGYAHFIVLNTYMDCSPSSPQYKWLVRNLAKINREVTPWLVVIHHAPWYHTNIAHQRGHEPQFAMKENIEELLYQNHVDIVVAGHVHAYERCYPMYKGKLDASGPFYLIVGGAGRGLSHLYVDKIPPWSAYRHASEYGYGTLDLVNSSHVLFEWHDHESGSKAADSKWLVRHRK